MPLDPGSVFAGFTVVRMLGDGAMGEVYLVNHPSLSRPAALKILPTEVLADPEFRERFDREADLAASLSHPHIVEVHDHGESDGQLWISMDYVEGTDCARLLSQHDGSGLPRDQVIEIIGAVAGALDYAHERGLLHRDVKPADILLGLDGTGGQRTMLADFGLARRADPGTTKYAAPEQLQGLPVDGRADQYALAVTAVELFCGETPFDPSDPAALIGARRPDLAGLDAALSKALAKEPDARFARCQDFADALRAAAPQAPSPADDATAGFTAEAPQPDLAQPAPTEQPTIPASPAKKSRKLGWIMAATVVVLGVAAAAILGTVWLTRKQHRGPSPEEQVRTTIQQFDGAVQRGDLTALRNLTCGTTRDGYLQYDENAWQATYQRTSAAKQYPIIASIDQVVVNGQHAEANVTTFMAYDPQQRSERSLDLQLRDGEWKICQSPGS